MTRARTFRILCVVVSIAVLYLFTMKYKQEHILTRLNQMDVEVERRILWWDWKDTPEEVACANPKQTTSPGGSAKSPIPYVVHYVMFGPAGQPAQIPFFAFLSIKATILRLQPQQIIIHSYDLDTKNSYWKLLKPYVTLRIHDKSQLKGPDNRPLDDFALAHQADFLRLSILSKEGGIYFDTDVFPLRSFSHLLNSPRDVLMGHEGGNRYGLGNAIILARPRSEFVRLWIKTYDNNAFNPKNWNEHSILMPKRLQVRYPQLICPLSPAAFFWPTWAKKHLNYMFETLGPRPIPPVGVEGPAVQELRRNMTAYGGAMYANQLALHIRANHITEEDIIREDTRFNILLRDVVETPLP